MRIRDDRAHDEAVERGVFHVVAKEGGELFVEEFLEALMPMADDRGFGARSVGEFAIAHGNVLGWRLAVPPFRQSRSAKRRTEEGGREAPWRSKERSVNPS